MKTIVNVETGEVTERELNAEELAQQAIDEAIFNAREQAKAEQTAAKQALLDKLGITAEEAQLLLGGS